MTLSHVRQQAQLECTQNISRKGCDNFKGFEMSHVDIFPQLSVSYNENIKRVALWHPSLTSGIREI